MIEVLWTGILYKIQSNAKIKIKWIFGLRPMTKNKDTGEVLNNACVDEITDCEWSRKQVKSLQWISNERLLIGLTLISWRQIYSYPIKLLLLRDIGV